MVNLTPTSFLFCVFCFVLVSIVVGIKASEILRYGRGLAAE
jgi:hypothetical protein